MMTKFNTRLLFLFSIFFSNFIVAQSQVEDSDTPSFTPPSPEAFSFTKVGEIPVNEVSGNASTDVPIHTFVAGKISVPISISHSGEAVKVDEDNTWTGINWQLSAGGLITRTVNDKADEKTQYGPRLHPEGSLPHAVLVDLCISTKDSEVDVFNYNFNGYSGSFYFDLNNVARQTKYDKELKIEMISDPISNKSVIVITTTDGTRYSFGGNDASESTRTRFGPGAFLNEFVQTAFYLYKIENISGDIVYFNYTRDGNALLRLLGYSQELVQFVSVEGGTECTPSYTNNAQLSTRKPYWIESSGRIRLTSITSNRDQNTRVEFSSITNSTTAINRQILDNLRIYDYKNTIRKRVYFEYIYPENASGVLYKRFFLSEIKFSYGSSSQEKYAFEYNNINELPERFSYSQDYGGYFNGKPNTTYVPLLNLVGIYPGNLTLANRNVDFIKSCYGSLKKVIYPTKGYTEFDYETVQDGIEGYVPGVERILNINYQSPTNSNNTHVYDSTSFLPTMGSDGFTIIPSDLNTTQVVKVSVSVSITGPIGHHNHIKLILKDLDSADEVIKSEQLPSNSDNTTLDLLFNYSFTALNPSGKYKISLEYYNAITAGYPISFNANARIKYSTHEEIPKYRPGIRIKRVNTYAKDSLQPLITRYYYNSAAKRSSLTDSQINVRAPNFVGNSLITGHCWVDTGDPFNTAHCVPYVIAQRKIYSNTQNNIYISDYNRNVYQYVTVSYGGDNFEKGGKESKYFIQADLPISPMSVDNGYVSTSKSSNNSLKNGTLLHEILFNNEATFDETTNQIITGKVKEVINIYQTLDEKGHRIKNYFTNKFTERPSCSAVSDNYIDNYYIGQYYIFSWWHTLASSTTREYFSTGVVETKQIYHYDNDVKLAGLPARVEQINSNNPADKTETKYYYPLFQETFGEPNRALLNANYILGAPMITETFKNNTKIAERKTIYNSQLQPNIIKSSKGDETTEKRVVYELYDSHDNPLQIRKENGTKVCYIWGYHQTQPVAKIENIEYSAIPPNLITAIQYATDSQNGSESNVLSALTALRNSTTLEGAMITTYTYKPLAGVTTITDPKGLKINYDYDSSNRLIRVTDSFNNILSANEYHYKN